MPKIQMEIGVEKSRGYVTADRQKNIEAHDRADPDGLDLLTDPQVTSPSTTRASDSRSTCDRLTLEIETNGSITPDDALSEAANIFTDQLALFIDFLDRREARSDGARQRVGRAGRDAQPFRFSSFNCLKRAGISNVLGTARHDRRRNLQDGATSARSRSTRSNKYSKKGPVAPSSLRTDVTAEHHAAPNGEQTPIAHSGPRRALLRSLATSFFLHEKIENRRRTTGQRDLQIAERLITQARPRRPALGAAWWLRISLRFRAS